ncbi:MAG: hypothetical protein JMDDDDMK_03696 [Acidobacteria bacterium]|nr:hypothetical protein [Acidobacteriota bacterium]
MVLCPACGSSRIRNDYIPAPLALRIFFIRALLCDHCNHQFKAFSLQEPKIRAQRPSARKAADFNQASTVDLTRLKDGAGGGKQSEAMVKPNTPQRLIIDLAALRLQSKTQEEVPGAIVIDQTPQSRRDLRTEITRLYAQGAKEPRQRKNIEQEQPTAPAPACTHCGSINVKRRRRTMLERMAFSVTDHKAFTCRSCGEAFYSKVEGDEKERGALGATGAAN